MGAVRSAVLLATALAAFAAVLVVAIAVPGDARWIAIETMIRASKVIALFGCLVGALSFRRRDHLFRGWLLMGGMYALLILRDAVIYRGLVIDPADPAARWIEAMVVVPANVLAVLGSWTMGRAWYVGGVALPGTLITRGVVRAATIAMAISITLPALWHYTPRAVAGDAMGVMGASTAIADALCLSMLAPVLLTAIALRGGANAWPWALLTCSMFGWLCYDVANSLSPNLTSGGEELRVLAEAFRVFAAVGAGLAGIAQRLAATAPAARTVPRSLP